MTTPKDLMFMVHVELSGAKESITHALKYLEDGNPELAASCMRLALQRIGNAFEEYSKRLHASIKRTS